MGILVNSIVKNGDVYVKNNDLIKSLLDDKANVPEDYPVDKYIDETIAEFLRYETEILKQYNNR